MKKLIINADDFGISASTNQAIKELFEEGKITSTSLLANAEFSQEALDIAKLMDISVGVHLTLNSDFESKPWKALSIDGGNSLYDNNYNLLYDTALIAKQAVSRDVTAECAAQIDKIIDYGVKVDHLDNHSGTMYGMNKRLFFINAFKLAKKFKLPFRFPKNNEFLNSYFSGNIPAVIKMAHSVVVGIAKMMRVKLIDNIITNPYKTEDIGEYRKLEDYYIAAIKNSTVEYTELFLHPSYACPIFSKLTAEWKKREWELQFLHSKALSDLIKNNGIELISYNDIL